MRLVMSAEQVREDRVRWLKERAKGVGASEIGTIMRLPGSHGSPYALWMEKTGRADPGQPGTRRMEFGLYCEAFTAWGFEDAHPELHLADGGLYAHDERDWEMATFDRLAHPHRTDCDAGTCEGREPTENVQLKIDEWRDYRETGIPLSYRAQVIQETDVGELEAGWLAVLNTAAADVAPFLIPRDEAWAVDRDLMIEAALEFRSYVDRDKPPPVDGLPATTEAIKARYPDLDPDRSVRLPVTIARKWRRAARAETKAAERKARWLNELRVRAGDAATWTTFDPGRGEVKIASRTVRPRAAYDVEARERVDTIHPARKWAP